MINALPLLLGDDGYQISRSVRLRSSASAYFNRTPASAGNRRTWTWSGWVKRGAISSSGYYSLFSAGTTSPTYDGFRFGVDSLQFFQAGGNSSNLVTTSVFRDPSAWYHVVLALDTTQATSSNRVKMYVNGVQITSFSTANYPSLNLEASINSTLTNVVGAQQETSAAFHFDGYLTDINFIDGQALTPAAFGETDAITGVWKPKRYTGTYGTNGFFLNFSDPSAATAAAIGADRSGNGNNWTPNNISVTAGATYDSMLDVPTPWADGGNGRGNYATFNPTIAASTGLGTITNGNLQCVTPTSGASNNYGTIGVSSGKWYWEITATARTTDSHIMIGINDNTQSATEFYSQSRGYAYRGNGEKWNNGSGVSYGSSAATGDIIGVAFDADAGSIEFFRNGSSMGVAYTGIAASTYFPAICDTGATVSWTATANFGQRPFAYTPPTGFKALNTQNLPEPTIKKGNQYFDVVTRNGTSAAATVSSYQFAPDLVWIKARNIAYSNVLANTVTGATKFMQSNTTAAEQTDVQSITSFNSNGYSLGTWVEFNETGKTYVDWAWKEGATQGFDIVTTTYTSGTETKTHSLGVTPSMIIVKRRDSTGSWYVAHSKLSSMNNNYLTLDSTAAQGTASWGGSPTSTNWYMSSNIFAAGTYVAYLFSEVPGFSRFGSYTGNGNADGPFVFCGFRPAFVLVKRSDSAGTWYLVDNKRNGTNSVQGLLYPNLSNAEATINWDILSNGFKMRDSGADLNASGGTYIFAAFAENPFKYSLAR